MPIPHGRPRPASRLVAAIATIASLAPMLTGAASGAESPPAPDSGLVATLSRLEGAAVTLDQALLAAVDGSIEVSTARADLDAARAALRRERGAFDPELFGETSRSSSDAPTASFFAGAQVLKTDETAGSFGARWRLRWGTELTASLDAVRRETNSTYASLNPEYDAGGRLSLRQPLLRGLGGSARVGLTAAERGFEAAQARFDDVTLVVRATVEGAYWDLYAAGRDWAVQSLSRDRAAALVEETSLRAQAGLVGPGQVANTRVFLAEQEQALLDRLEALDAASDRLGTLVGLRPAGDARRFLTADEPDSAHAVPDEEASVTRALAANLELHASERALAALRAHASAAGRDALPQLDLFGTLGGAGLAGEGRDIILAFGAEPETLRTATTGDLGESIDQVLRRTYPNWTIGLSFTLPLGGRRAGGERDRLRAEVARAEHQLEGRRRALADQVRTLCRELANGQKRLAAARDGVSASQEQVRIGLLEYRAGSTTAFELVRLSADLAAAQQRHSQALVRSARAASELRRLTANGYTGKEMGQ